jgi:hypothetical protein
VRRSDGTNSVPHTPHPSATASATFLSSQNLRTSTYHHQKNDGYSNLPTPTVTHIFNVIQDRNVTWVGFRGQDARSAVKASTTIMQCLRMRRHADRASALVDRFNARVVCGAHDRVEQRHRRDRPGQQRGVIGVGWERRRGRRRAWRQSCHRDRGVNVTVSAGGGCRTRNGCSSAVLLHIRSASPKAGLSTIVPDSASRACCRIGPALPIVVGCLTVVSSGSGPLPVQ